MRKIQKTTLFLAGLMMASTTCVACSGGVQYAPEEKADTAYLYVQCSQGGLGKEYLDKLATAFEEKFKDNASYFAEGKTKVDVVVSESKNAVGPNLLTSIANSDQNIFVAERTYYFDFLAQDLLYDLTDITKATLEDGTTIEGKLFDDQKESLTVKNGKYYALPTFSGFTGLTYDAEVFEDNYLYFADDVNDCNKPYATSSYTGKAYTGRGFVWDENSKKSTGPDGQYNTYDDGLPSSYEEFFYMMDALKETATPLIWTGNSMHYTNYLFQALLCANSTKTEFVSNFTFDSKGEKIKVVDGFDAQNEPIIKEVVITDDNGYETLQQVNYYKALKFLYHLFSNEEYYDSRSAGQSLSNTSAQKIFEESGPNPKTKDIAMIIEGNYWYNEAASELKESEGKYANAKNRNFRFMPLPAKEYGTVEENEGTTITLADSLDYYLVANNNIKGNTEKKKLVEEFVKMFYLDESLQQTNVTTGMPLALKYDLKKEQYDSLDNFPQSLWDIYKLSKDSDSYVTPLSANPIFYNHTDKFCFKSTGTRFHSVIGGIERANTYTAFMEYDATAKSYFEGMKIGQTNWNSNYLK
ncbi:MAG: hypothetical protein IJD33_04075 [Clostridia bacterium]|nr:hypothetical protein [Clostridia bacterium]